MSDLVRGKHEIPKCSECGSGNLNPIDPLQIPIQPYICKDCGHKFSKKLRKIGHHQWKGSNWPQASALAWQGVYFEENDPDYGKEEVKDQEHEYKPTPQWKRRLLVILGLGRLIK